VAVNSHHRRQSGSPFVDAQGRLVGLALDKNIHSIRWKLLLRCRDELRRAGSPAAHSDWLAQVYRARAMAKELEIRP
jgi:hypothetical protein